MKVQRGWKYPNGEKNERYRPEARIEYIVVFSTVQHFLGEPNPSYLHAVREHAARQAQVPAYWISTSYLGESKEEQSNNVWRICDIIRTACSLVVAVSNPASQGTGKDTEMLLKE